MKKLLLLIISICWLSSESIAQANIYKGIGTIVFEAGAPLSLIKGTSEAANGVIDLETGKFRFDVPINSFQFLNSLMHERFNDKYMQSHRFQRAIFTGEITDRKPIANGKGTKLTATGTLTIHGVSQKRTIIGILSQKGDVWQLASDFMVNLEDHHIQAPKLSSGYGAHTMQVALQMPLKQQGSTPQQPIAASRKLSLK
ncbi:YceI family protein [Pontibacter roseus]|uniref:YceI family protein n=1 Tax=Pontibacter roseus TaxID=336989 RepID=UPI0003725B61|nr:YceI family protein [Pontibacter roseus]